MNQANLCQKEQIIETKTRFVRKRNNDLIAFDANKIFEAILKAVETTNEFDAKECNKLTKQIAYNCGLFSTIYVEQIQDLVERTLFEHGYYQTAKAYTLYREKHRVLREDSKTIVDVISTVSEYIDESDWRVKANANQNYSVGGLILNSAGKVIANYWLNHVYTEQIKKAHIEGDLHIHDLDMLSGYCAGWSLRNLLHEGFNGCKGKVESKPPKHFRTALGQMVNFLGTLQNEWAGAQAFSSFDTYLAPYVRKDNLDYEQVFRMMEEFVFNLNVPSRWGSQPPFTNLTFDWICPEDMKDEVPLISGDLQEFTYGELQKEMDMINKAYLEVMKIGDAKGRIFSFPIPTYNITKDFDWDSKNTTLLFELTARYGLPYFQNFINSELNPKMIRSMCCRLQLDLRELLKRGNGLFGSAEQTGSIGVVTMNCARLGYAAKGDREALFNRYKELLELAKDSLETKRKFIARLVDNGLFPYTKRYLRSLNNHFSTIGVNGINECVRNFYEDEEDITSPKGYELALELLDYAREMMLEFQAETGNLYNLEASPAEGATYRFAKTDKKLYPNILQAGTEENPYYTNSSQLPVKYTDDPFVALNHQENLQKKYTGGTVFHTYIPEEIEDPNQCKNLVKKILNKYRIPYLTISPTFSVCPTHGHIPGEVHECPKCGQTCEVWTRVMGYHRPVSSYNIGKKGEFKERKYYRSVENVNL